MTSDIAGSFFNVVCLVLNAAVKEEVTSNAKVIHFFTQIPDVFFDIVI